ncbi:MAG: hypothetical protein AB7E80_04300 [Hyphomicrobiaceae bacterium]
MSWHETLLIAAVALEIAVMLMSGRLTAGGAAEQATGRVVGDLGRRFDALALAFFLTAAAALWWRIADGWVSLFAALFIAAHATGLILMTRSDTIVWSVPALRAALIALIGLGAVVVLALLPGDADGMMVP